MMLQSDAQGAGDGGRDSGVDIPYLAERNRLDEVNVTISTAMV